MDKSSNWAHGGNGTTPSPGQYCINSSGSSLDKLLITSPSLFAVNQDLKWIFFFHTYLFACLFFILGFYTFFSILNLRSLISSRPFMSTINIFLCLLGVSRSGCLFIDPYNLKESMPKVIGSILWDIGFPCITSAFCLIQLAFLQLTQLKFGPEKIQRESCLSLIITAHFSCVLASDVALAFHNNYIFKYMLQSVFLVWSILLYSTFLHAGYKVMQLLKNMPVNMLTRDNSTANQKGIMQLAMLAPYNNLATSVAAALVPTLLTPKPKGASIDALNPVKNPAEATEGLQKKIITPETKAKEKPNPTDPPKIIKEDPKTPISTVPEVYVRPPTPTPSSANLPIITVSSPSRRSSISSRRGSDVSRASSRRNSECSVRFNNNNDDNDNQSVIERRSGKFNNNTEDDFSNSRMMDISPTDNERSQTPDSILRRHSENVSICSSSKDLRRCSDFTHEKNRGSQFASKLRRNSDFGNRTPKRMLPTENEGGHRLSRVLDVSPTASRRNSDIGSFMTTKSSDSRRNSDISYRRGSELGHIKPLVINTRRSSDISIRTLDKSPTHYQQTILPVKEKEIQEKSESDSDQPDCNEKASLMSNNRNEETKVRKKSLTWKTEKMIKGDNDDITAETSLLPENVSDNRVTGADFTLHSILNHIAYVNRTKTDTPLQIPINGEGTSLAAATRKSQIRRVLNVTYATAVIGIALCIADIVRIIGPYGILAETIKYGTRPTPEQYPKPWPWLLYQTLCRAMELIMGCAMASITKQPSASPRHQYLNSYPNYSLRVKQRDSLYI